MPAAPFMVTYVPQDKVEETENEAQETEDEDEAWNGFKEETHGLVPGATEMENRKRTHDKLRKAETPEQMKAAIQQYETLMKPKWSPKMLQSMMQRKQTETVEETLERYMANNESRMNAKGPAYKKTWA